MNSTLFNISTETSSSQEELTEPIDIWLSQKVQQLLLCEDSLVNEFIRNGLPILNTFLTSTESLNVLFVLMKKVVPELEMENKSEEEEKTSEKKKQVTIVIEEPSTLKNKKNVKINQQDKIKSATSTTKKENSKQRKQTKKKPAKKKKPFEESLKNEVEFQLEWQTQQYIPTTDQFIAILPRLNTNLEAGSLDERFHVIHMGANRLFRSALAIARDILDDEFSFEMQVTILLTFTSLYENRIPTHLSLERFIIQSICSYYCVEARAIHDSSDDDRSISLLLADTIHKYCAHSENRLCLFLQLALYDLEIVSENTDINYCANRLIRSVQQLDILLLVYGDKIHDWIRKTFIYSMDLYSSSIAQFITRKSKQLFEFEPDQKSFSGCVLYMPYISECKKFSKILFDSFEDSELMEKILLSFNVIILLEKEIERMTEKVTKLYELESDLSVEKRTIEEKQKLFHEMKAFLEENCLQSAIESGNTTTLKTILTAMIKYNKSFNKILNN